MSTAQAPPWALLPSPLLSSRAGGPGRRRKLVRVPGMRPWSPSGRRVCPPGPGPPHGLPPHKLRHFLCGQNRPTTEDPRARETHALSGGRCLWTSNGNSFQRAPYSALCPGKGRRFRPSPGRHRADCRSLRGGTSLPWRIGGSQRSCESPRLWPPSDCWG